MVAFNQNRSPERFEERVMAWLWTRPQAQIVALRDTSVSSVYRYPVLDALTTEDEFINKTHWLSLIADQGLLEATELVDRIRLCVQCNIYTR